MPQKKTRQSQSRSKVPFPVMVRAGSDFSPARLILQPSVKGVIGGADFVSAVSEDRLLNSISG